MLFLVFKELWLGRFKISSIEIAERGFSFLKEVPPPIHSGLFLVFVCFLKLGPKSYLMHNFTHLFYKNKKCSGRGWVEPRGGAESWVNLIFREKANTASEGLFSWEGREGQSGTQSLWERKSSGDLLENKCI